MSKDFLKEDDSSELSLQDFFKVSGWIFQLILKTAPFKYTLYILLTFIRNIRFILYTYLMSKVLNFAGTYILNPKTSFNDLYFYLFLLLLYNIGSTSLNYIYFYLRQNLTFSTNPKLQDLYAQHLTKLGLEKLQSSEINNKLHRCQGSVNDLFSYSDQCIRLISSVVRFISVGFTILIIFPLFIPLILVASIPYFILDKRFRSLIWKFIHGTTEQSRNASGNLYFLYNFRSLPEVYINSSVSYFREKFLIYKNWYEQARLKIVKKWYVSNALTLSLPDVVSMLGVVQIFKGIKDAHLNLGQVSFYLRMLEDASNGISEIASSFNEAYGWVFRFKDLYYIFNVAQPFEDGEVILPRFLEGPQIEFKKVAFVYPGGPSTVFKNLNFTIKPREKVAIVGHNGAGKTTLIKLISRFYKASEGEILINGSNLNTFKIEEWYKNMGVLLQEYNTYGHLSVKENIFLGRPNEPLNEIDLRLAAQSADCLSFVEEYPNKFDQILDESYKGGIRPSTGQWQKIAIARLFYRNPSLVIFDEPTSSIDAVSEYNIFNKIYSFFEGKTVIIVSHRFSTVRNADRIIVLEKGEIVEEGSHSQLISQNGYYSKAFNLQAEGYVD